MLNFSFYSKYKRLSCFHLCLFFIFIFFGPSNIKAEMPLDSNKKIIPFQMYNRILKEKLPEIKKSYIEEKISKNKIYKEKKTDDWQLESGVKYLIDNQRTKVAGAGNFDHIIDSGIDSGVLTEENRINSSYSGEIEARSLLQGAQVDTGISRTFSATGTRIKTGIQFGYLDSRFDYHSNPEMLNGKFSDQFYLPVIYVGIAQPFLKNSFGLLDRFAKKDAIIKYELEKLKQKQYRKSLESYYKKIYFDWIVTLKVIDILESTIKTTQKMVVSVQRHYRSGMTDLDDLNKMNLALYQYQDQLNKKQNTLRQITILLEPYIDTREYDPDIQSFTEYINKSLNHPFSLYPFEKTTHTAIYRLSMKRTGIAEKANENAALPELNLFAEVNKKGQDGDIKESWNDLIDKKDNVTLEAGLIVKYPLGNHEARGALKEIFLLKKQLRQDYQTNLRKYQAQINQLYHNALSLQTSLEFREKSISALKIKLKTEYHKYNTARLNLTFVLDTENHMAQEQMELLLVQRKLIDLYIDYQNLVY